MQHLFFYLSIALHFSIMALTNSSQAAFTLGQLMEATPEIGKALPQLAAVSSLSGKKVTIAGQIYEWHYFYFSDPEKNLSGKISFADYVSNNSLHSMKSLEFQPIKGLAFAYFNASHADTDNEAYFNILLLRIEEES